MPSRTYAKEPNLQDSDTLKMVREGFPTISKPLPAILQKSDYADSPLVVKREEISTFEENSTPNWLHSLCNTILPAKWGNKLFANRTRHEASVFAPVKLRSTYSVPLEMSKPAPLFSHIPASSSGRNSNYQAREAISRESCSNTLPDLPRLSWTDWHSEDLLRALRWSSHETVECPQPGTTDSSSSVNEVLNAFVEDAMLQADDLDELDHWTADFPVDTELLWKATDRIIFRENPAAWETLTYLLGDQGTIDHVRVKYSESQRDIKNLGLYLYDGKTEDKRTSLALWRIWAYCILSMESFILGQSIAVQVDWLRGPVTDRALLAHPRFNVKEDQSWMICRRNGIFAQCNSNLSKSAVDDMVQIWTLLGQKWMDATGETAAATLSDKSIMYIFSRVTGPRDLLNIMQGLQHNCVSFLNALCLTHGARAETPGSPKYCKNVDTSYVLS